MIKWDHWHIEPSSICALRCPRCPRAEVPDSLLNRQLTLNFFQTQIGAQTIQHIRKITFCGNDGDPIYCKDFLDICRWIKSVNPSISLVIITNGSYKPTEWWIELASIVDHRDEIHWSLDGWDQDSNAQYRVNSNWHSIQQGIDGFFSHNTSAYRVWDCIAFRFNAHHIEAMRHRAKLQNFDCFQLTKSTKFGSKYPQAYGHNDPLEPTDCELVSSSYRYQRTVTELSNKTRPNMDLRVQFQHRVKTIAPYSGICLIGNKGVFVNSQGEFYPCCWVANRYPHNQSWQAKFDLKSKTFDQIIADNFWTTEFLQFDNLECKTKCTVERLNDPAHTTEW